MEDVTIASHFAKEKGEKHVSSSVQTCALRCIRIIRFICLFIYIFIVMLKYPEINANKYKKYVTGTTSDQVSSKLIRLIRLLKQ